MLGFWRILAIPILQQTWVRNQATLSFQPKVKLELSVCHPQISSTPICDLSGSAVSSFGRKRFQSPWNKHTHTKKGRFQDRSAVQWKRDWVSFICYREISEQLVQLIQVLKIFSLYKQPTSSRAFQKYSHHNPFLIWLGWMFSSFGTLKGNIIGKLFAHSLVTEPAAFRISLWKWNSCLSGFIYRFCQKNV